MPSSPLRKTWKTLPSLQGRAGVRLLSSSATVSSLSSVATRPSPSPASKCNKHCANYSPNHPCLLLRASLPHPHRRIQRHLGVTPCVRRSQTANSSSHQTGFGSSFLCSFIRSFLQRSFVHPFIRSFVHSFIRKKQLYL